MRLIPKALQEVIEALAKLPGVGPRSAERYANFLLRSDPSKSQDIGKSLIKMHNSIGYCKVTFALVEKNQEYSELYTDPSRDKTLVAVVAEPLDIVALERTGSFKGTYHVLGGLVSPIDGIGQEQLTIDKLVSRVDTDNVQELILATNASIEGETTLHYIKQALGSRTVKITRLAQGLPMGVDIEYADQLTLIKALEHRQTLVYN